MINDLKNLDSMFDKIIGKGEFDQEDLGDLLFMAGSVADLFMWNTFDEDQHDLVRDFYLVVAGFAKPSSDTLKSQRNTFKKLKKMMGKASNLKPPDDQTLKRELEKVRSAWIDHSEDLLDDYGLDWPGRK